MSALATLKATAKRHGGIIEHKKQLDVDTNQKVHQFTAWAPPGKLWEADGIHCLCDMAVVGNEIDTRHAIDYMIERMNYGLTDCTDPECDHCHPTYEEVTDA